MGMPACHITSQTAHGGIVILGFPTVLIGMLPASRIGDMHTCPMVTGVVPHVGGPFILGSPTVLVGNMPQSRVTDQLTCVGPPDVAVMGCETVLVGMAGGAGAAGAAAGAAALGVPVPAPPPSSSSAVQAVVQYDGTVNTWSPSGNSLPPIPLSHPGWPPLAPENTATFSSVQPVTLPQGTQLFAAADSESGGETSFWSSAPPQSADPSKDIIKVLTVTNPEGMKAWAGQAAGQGQQAADQALTQAQQTLQQAEQQLNTAIQQAQQQRQAARATVEHAQQALDQAAAQNKTAAQHALTRAQQLAQQVEQQAIASVQQAQQQLKQAQQQLQQAQQTAGQAQSTATQVCTNASSTASQTFQSIPRKF